MSFRSIVSLLCGGALALAATTCVFAQQGPTEYGSSTGPAATSTDQGGTGQVKKKSKAKTAKTKTAKTKTGTASAKPKQGQ